MTRIITNTIALLFIGAMLSLGAVHCKKGETISKTTDDTSKQSPADTNKLTEPVDTIVPIKQLPMYIFIGTYTGSGSKGIYVYEIDSLSGNFTEVTTIMANNPSYLAIHPNREWIYAVNEQNSGKINAYKFDTVAKKLTLLNAVSSKGDAPCYVSIDNTGKFVMVANYSSGTVAVFPINANGSLSEASSTITHTGKSIDAGRQSSPHAHMIAQSAVNNFVYACDLGIDKVLAYKLDTLSGKLTSSENASISAGAGPRHWAEHKGLKTMYVLCELKGMIEVFKINEKTAALENIQQIPSIEENETRYPGSADIHIAPNGKFLYATNRGDVNTIAMYAIDQTTGKLNLTGFESVLGKAPRNFAISPNGKFLLVANQDSGNLKVFTIGNDGKLSSNNIELKVPKPVCVKFW